MSFNVSNSLNSAIVSGVLGAKKASDGITFSSVKLAQQQASLKTTQQLLSDVSLQTIGNATKLLPTGGDSLTSNLLSLSNNLNNFQASLSVVDAANDTVGKLIDTLA